ncbi:MAG: hypothetical protein KDB54_03415 [Solirubrobacterales bacterium]|nr:hypothetical protein [Solirubrobacterales bacterium]HRV61185.1 hypothetical protein [Solirubrobacterales bacterium]
MLRLVDREIKAWSRGTAQAQLGLLWDEVERNGVKAISWWERDEWSSPYLISASEDRSLAPGKFRAFCQVNFGRPEDDEMLFSDDSEARGRDTPVETMGARDIRRMLELPGVEERPELCDLLINIGYRRDEMDLPAITSFAGHQEPVVRYVVLGMLSWNPSLTNDYLGGKFEKDPDPAVRELAERFASGRLRRQTRI